MRYHMVATALVFTLLSRVCVFAESFNAFENGYAVTQLTESTCRKNLLSARIEKTQPIGGTALWVPGLGDVQGVDMKSPDGEILVSVLLDPESRVGENEYGTVVVSKDYKTMVMVYRGTKR